MSQARDGADSGLQSMVAKVRETAARNPASERLLKEVESYLSAKSQQVLTGAASKLGETTRRLTDVADGTSAPGGLLGRAAGEMAGGAGPGKAAAKAGAKSLGDTVKKLFSGGGGGSGTKSMKIVEDIDVGVPVRVAYDQWTKLQDFPSWSKGAQSVNQEDPVTSTWKAKVFWSTRNWTAKVTEQVPDERIAWTSDGPKGVVNGVVTFHEIGDRLTRVLMVLEYIPAGLFEKTGNLWRSQGRRARLDLKLYRHHVMTDPDAGQNGWRGEIRDGEVVNDSDDSDEDVEAHGPAGGEPDDEEPPAARGADDEEPDDEEPTAARGADDDEPDDEEEPDEEPDDEEEPDEEEPEARDDDGEDEELAGERRSR